MVRPQGRLRVSERRWRCVSRPARRPADGRASVVRAAGVTSVASGVECASRRIRHSAFGVKHSLSGMKHSLPRVRRSTSDVKRSASTVGHAPSGIAARTSALVCAAAAVLSYLEETQKTSLGHIRPLRRHVVEDHLSIDPTSWRSLEIDRTLRSGGTEGTLLSAIDRTRSPMGARLLRQSPRHQPGPSRRIRMGRRGAPYLRLATNGGPDRRADVGNPRRQADRHSVHLPGDLR